MQKFQDKLIKYLMPIAEKLDSQKHIQAIKDGMIAGIPIIIVGSFCLLPLAFANLLQSGAVFDFLIKYMDVFTYAVKFTNDLLSIYVAMFIARSLAKQYGIENGQIMITALAFHLIISTVGIDGGLSTNYLGATGLFTSIISGLITVEVTRLLLKYNIVIKLPDSVPEMVTESFGALIPLVTNIVIAVGIAIVSLNVSGEPFPAMLMTFLAPAISTMDTLPALLIVIFLTQLLWFFGLHGPSITSAVWAPFAISYGAANIAAYANNETVMHIFTFGFYYNILQVTGSGLTLGLVILMMRSKSQKFKAIGKASIAPSLFGINEPVIFGAPIILNPFMFIPFVFGPLLVTVLAYFGMTLGFITKPIANPPGFMPPGVGAYLMTFDWTAVVFVFFSLFLMTAIYYPFFKMMEAQELKNEES